MRALVTVAAAVCMAACGAKSAETRTAYAVEVSRCMLNERAIVDDSTTTPAEDAQNLEVERARCDAALREIEARP